MSLLGFTYGLIFIKTTPVIFLSMGVYININYFRILLTLAPNESRVLEMLHKPDCIFRSICVALNFEYRGRNTRVDSNFNKVNSFQQKNFKLLLRYDINAREIKECIPALKLL